MGELVAAGITTLDIVVVYALLQIREGKLTLALWTSFLNIILPLLGFIIGEYSSTLFSDWTNILSGVLLGLIGLHMLLQDDEAKSSAIKLHPAIIAAAVSMDAFSVSVSFGMLHMNKLLFICASGIFAFLWAYVALHIKGRLGLKNGKNLRRFAGLVLLTMGILSSIH